MKLVALGTERIKKIGNSGLKVPRVSASGFCVMTFQRNLRVFRKLKMVLTLWSRMNYHTFSLQYSKDPTMQLIYKRSVLKENSETGIRTVCQQNNYAHLTSIEAIDTVLKKLENDCPLYIIKEHVIADYYYLITQKGTLLSKRLSKG